MSLDLLVFIPSISQVSYVQTKYLLVTDKKIKKFSLRSSLDPFFYSDSIADHNRCKENECISIL